MAEETLQAGVEPEDRLARLSRWATAALVIPLLTGLSFAASTVFGFVYSGGRGFIEDVVWPLAIILLIPGIGLGFPLRRVVIRIRDTGRFRRDIWVVVGVGLAWILAGFVQSMLFIFSSI